jgi:RNA-directed DNA polymerase
LDDGDDLRPAVPQTGEQVTFVKDWVEKKVRRHMMRARNRPGFGWKRWSRAWLYEALGLFADYRVRYLSHAESTPGR